MRPVPLSLIILLLPTVVMSSVLPVQPDGSGPYPHISAALLSAQAGDSILLADGIFTGQGNRNLELAGELTIISAGGDPDLCVLDLEGVGRGFLIRSHPGTDIDLVGFTIRHGDAGELPPELWGDSGGAIFIDGLAPGGSVQVRRCVLESNSAAAGGAVFCWQAEALFDRCRFGDNIATDGGGVYCGYCLHGDGVRFTDSVFHGNDYPDPQVGGYGGGIYFSHSRGEVTGCTLALNLAWLGSGVLISTDSDVNIASSIIAFNGDGAGLSLNNGSLRITACDIFGNEGGDWVGILADSLGVNCNVEVDPLFCDLEDLDLTLREDSPCLPAGSGGCGLIGALPQGCQITGLDSSGEIALSSRPRLERCFPNPFNPTTDIVFNLSVEGHVRLSVHDVTGRLLKELVTGVRAAGRHQLTWDGRDRNGHSLPSGTYLLRLHTTTGQESRQLTLIR